MSTTDKVIAFKFTRPGMSDKDKPEPRDERENDRGDDSAPTRDELGAALAEAMDAGDGEAIFEAVRKIVDNPDAE